MVKYFDVNAPGHSIRCKLYTNDIHKIQSLILFVHGFAGHKNNRSAERFAERILTKYPKCAVMTFDLPAHGDDVKKRIVFIDCMTYLTLCLIHVRETLKVSEIYCYATSFGGFLILRYIKEFGNPFRKIVLRCPAINMYEIMMRRIVANDELETLNKGKDVLCGFDRKIKANKQFFDALRENAIAELDFMEYADDIMILHGTKDEVVPIRESEEFCDRNVIEFVPVENADHRFSELTLLEVATAKTIEFFGL